MLHGTFGHCDSLLTCVKSVKICWQLKNVNYVELIVGPKHLRKLFLPVAICSSPISSVQSLSCVWLFVTPWAAGFPVLHYISWSLLKLRSIEYSIVNAMVFPVIMYRCDSWTIRLSTDKLMLSNCGAREDSWESLGQQGDQHSQS